LLGLGTIEWTAVEFEPPQEVTLKTKPFVSCAQIKARIAKRYRITVADLVGPSRRREFAKPRQIAMALAYRRLKTRGYSLPMIGRNFGDRDHATVWYACKKFGMRPDPVASERGRQNRLKGYARRIPA